MNAVAVMVGAAVATTIIWLALSTPDRTAAVSNVMLQAMERGYQCHAAGRPLDDCKAEQRRRWQDPDLYKDKPFGAGQ